MNDDEVQITFKQDGGGFGYSSGVECSVNNNRDNCRREVKQCSRYPSGPYSVSLLPHLCSFPSFGSSSNPDLDLRVPL